MADIFISYSRHDSAFADQLRKALIAQGRSVWVDTSDILPTSEWRQDIIDAIEAASAVLFVLSPDWLASEVSQRELQYAVEMQKKLIPVVYRDVDHRFVNPALANLNWIFARPTDDPTRSLQQILFAIDTDLVYWREGSDLLVKARQWTHGNRRPAFTLRGEPLRQAEQWLAASATKQPGPSALQIEYITAGRRASAARQRTTIGSLTAGIIIALVLAIISTSLAGALNVVNGSLNSDNKTLSADAIAARSSEQLINNQFDSALLLARYGHTQHVDSTTTESLFNALEYSPNMESQLQSNLQGTFAQSALAASYASDGKTAMTASRDGHVVIWNMATNQPRNQFMIPMPDNEPNSLIAAAYSPDGKYVATDQGGLIQLADPATGTVVTSLATPFADASNDQTFTFSHDSKYLVTSVCANEPCSTEQVILWNLATPDDPQFIPVTTIAGYIPADIPSGIRIIQFSPDDHLLAVVQCADTDRCLRTRLDLFNVGTHAHLATIAMSLVAGEAPQGQIYTIAFSPDGSTIALGGDTTIENIDTMKIAFWNVSQQQMTTRSINDDTSTGLAIMAYSPDGQLLATGENNSGRIKLWDLTLAQPTLYPFQFKGHSGTVEVLAFSPDSQHFISSGFDDRIILWRRKPFSSLSDPNGTFVLSPDGKLSAENDGSTHQIIVRSSDAGTIQATITFPNEILYSLAISPDDKTLAAGFENANIRLWNIPSGQQLGDTIVDNPIGAASTLSIIHNLAFSPDGTYLLSTALYDYITVRKLATLQVVYQYSPPKDAATLPFNGAFSPDGRYLAFGNGTNDVQLLSLATGEVVANLTGDSAPVLTAAFNHDGSLLASLDMTGKIIFWDMKTRKPTGLPVFDRNPVALTPNLTFSPDSTLLVSSHDLGFTIWNVKERKLYVTPIATGNYVLKTNFSPDGKYLISILDGSETDVRDIRSDDWPNLACTIANRNLSPGEWMQLLGGIPNVPSHGPKICSSNP